METMEKPVEVQPIADDPRNDTEPLETPQTDAEWRREMDELLAKAQAEFKKSQPREFTLPQMLGEYEKVEGKDGVYIRPMCLEVELRALELYDTLSDGTVTGLARIAVGIAACVLYRLGLPSDEATARRTILAYVRGEVPETDIFVPLTEVEVGRLFRNTDELKRLVLDPLDIRLLDAGEADPNP